MSRLGKTVLNRSSWILSIGEELDYEENSDCHVGELLESLELMNDVVWLITGLSYESRVYRLNGSGNKVLGIGFYNSGEHTKGSDSHRIREK